MSDNISLDRATYKRIKSFDRGQMEKFLTDICSQTAKDHIESNAVSLDLEKLRKEIGAINGVGEKRLNEIMAIIESNLTTEKMEH